ncbi:hypothetical protein PVAND_016441 [Polypedilum vanderplanki]|uniref:Uncharacterized protein n=1 Tax=Polypedilum vanderplanki TaxID=319348 RepID=A0A9J6BG99_POLVA|nr:hypothetical protein PVAND_016441 [Polypedilum vanderplanki]
MFEGGNNNLPKKSLSNQWKTVVLNSTEKCKKEVIFDDNRIKDDDYNFVYTKFIECVKKENFINCPSLSKSEICLNMKDIMEKYCGPSNYGFLHEFFFEDFYYRNKTATGNDKKS